MVFMKSEISTPFHHTVNVAVVIASPDYSVTEACKMKSNIVPCKSIHNNRDIFYD